MSIYEKYPYLLDVEFLEGYDFDTCWTVENPDSSYAELDVAVALLRSKGNLSAAARYLCRSRRTLETFTTRDKDLSDLLEDIEAEFLDEVESTLRLAARVDLNTGKFFLKTKGKNRGYSERAELGGINGGPIELEVSPRAILLDRVNSIASKLGTSGTAKQSDGS